MCTTNPAVINEDLYNLAPFGSNKGRAKSGRFRGLVLQNQCIAFGDYRFEKAGVGGSTPSLARSDNSERLGLENRG
jgi:hypothetical protein